MLSFRPHRAACWPWQLLAAHSRKTLLGPDKLHVVVQTSSADVDEAEPLPEGGLRIAFMAQSSRYTRSARSRLTLSSD